MPYWRLFYHVVWATARREPTITPEREPHVWSAVRRAARRHGLIVHAVGGYRNHVHLLFSAPPATDLATSIGRVKGTSARWLALQFGERFRWQREYGVISLSEQDVPTVVDYVRSQRDRHERRELLPLLEQHAEDRRSGPAGPPAPT